MKLCLMITITDRILVLLKKRRKRKRRKRKRRKRKRKKIKRKSNLRINLVRNRRKKWIDTNFMNNLYEIKKINMHFYLSFFLFFKKNKIFNLMYN